MTGAGQDLAERKGSSRGASARSEGSPGEVGVRHRPRRWGSDRNWSAGEEEFL